MQPVTTHKIIKFPIKILLGVNWCMKLIIIFLHPCSGEVFRW